MLNGNWYRMTEKQDMESPSESGIEFEAFNISEAKRISTRRQKVKGSVLVLEELTGRAARGVNQRRAWKMDGPGRDVRLRDPHGSGHSSSLASLFRPVVLWLHPVRGWSLLPFSPAVDPGSPSRIPILSRVPDRLSSATNKKCLKSVWWA